MSDDAVPRQLVPVVPRQPWGWLCLIASFATFPGMATMTAAGVARSPDQWGLGLLQFILFVAGIFLVSPARPVGLTLFLLALVWQWGWGILILVRSGEAHA